MSCEAQRDLVLARARQPLKPGSKPAQPTGAAHRTGILKPLRVSALGACHDGDWIRLHRSWPRAAGEWKARGRWVQPPAGVPRSTLTLARYNPEGTLDSA